MNMKQLGSLAPIVLLIAVLATALPVSAVQPVQDPGPRISLSGSFLLLNGSLPATWHYDPAQRKILIDIEVGENLHTWAVLDWSGASPAGYIGREDGCFSFPISQQDPPSPDRFTTLLESPPYDTARVDPAEMASGLTSVRDAKEETTYLVMKEEGALLVFKVGSAFRASSPVDLTKNVSACQPISTLMEALGRGSRTPREAPQAADSSSLLQYNLPYTFRGLIYGHLSYKGDFFSQTKPVYDAALQKCENDGKDKCKPYYESGGWFGRYGYHCGDGWGGGYSDRVSGMDHCCRLHDLESWGSNQTENLCGFAACMTCKHYTNLGDWEQNFRGDFWAQKAIALFVGPGIAATLCHPQNHLTGFTCD